MAKTTQMKKPSAPPPSRPKQDVAKRASTEVGDLQAQMQKDSGRGLSQDASDNLVPLLYVLQPLSPQVIKKNPKYIQGAEAGDLWLRGMAEPIVKCDENDDESGLIFQPCHFYKEWVEWVPRKDGGGFVGRHAEKPDEAVQKASDPEKPNRQSWKLGDNDLVETRYFAGLVHMPDGARVPYIIPFSSTGHSVAKGWMFQMNQKQLPNGGGRPPMFGLLYRLTTVMRSNTEGEWFVIQVDEHLAADGTNFVQTTEDYQKGKQIFEAFDSGAKRGEDPVHDDAVHGGASDDDEKTGL